MHWDQPDTDDLYDQHVGTIYPVVDSDFPDVACQIDVWPHSENNLIAFSCNNPRLMAWLAHRLQAADAFFEKNFDAKSKDLLLKATARQSLIEAVPHTGKAPDAATFVGNPPKEFKPTSPEPVKPDRWQQMWELQLEFMEMLGIHPNQMNFLREGKREEIAEKIVMAMSTEVTEVLNELPWKTWTKTKPVDKIKLADELADVQHYVIEIAALMGITPVQFFLVFLKKNRINRSKLEQRLAEKNA